MVYPTDTLYGLGGDFFNSAVHRRIDALKGRLGQAYSVALWDLEAVERLAAPLPRWYHQHAHQVFPGPFTLVFPASPSIDPLLLKGKGTIAIRIPSQPFPLSALAEIRIPLITTSVNRSGSVPIADPQEILDRFPGIDLLIDAGPLPASKGSTILDLSDSPPTILRRGEGMERLTDLGIH